MQDAPPDASAYHDAPPAYVQLVSGLDKLLSSEAVAAVQQFLEAVEAYERTWAENDATASADKASGVERAKPPQPIVFAVSSNKDERTAVHHFFKQPGLPKCSTETVPASKDGQNSMRLCYHAQVTECNTSWNKALEFCDRQRTYALCPTFCFYMYSID